MRKEKKKIIKKKIKKKNIYIIYAKNKLQLSLMMALIERCPKA